MFTFQRIIEFNYPLRFEERSKFTLFDLGEKNDCEIIKSGKLLELKKLAQNPKLVQKLAYFFGILIFWRQKISNILNFCRPRAFSQFLFTKLSKSRNYP